MSRRPVAAAASGALALAAIAFALVLGELAARLAWSPPRPPDAPRDDPALTGLPRLESLADLARPRVRGVHEGVLFRTNSRGVRGPERAPAPPSGTFRIVVAGDSLTMGHGVTEEEAYPARLEALLNGATAGPRYEVINLGLSGLATRHVLRRLERVGLSYQPDLLVYGFSPNDIEGDAYRPGSDVARAAFVASLLRFREAPSYLLRILWPRLVVLHSSVWPRPGSYEHALAENYLRNPAAWDQVARGLDRLAALAAARQICAHVFVHPVLQQLRLLHPYTRVYARVMEAARNRGLTASAAFEALRGRDASALRFSVVDSHPNAEGHRLLAGALFDALAALPPRCGVALR